MFHRNGPGNAKTFNMGHPKLAKLEEVVLDHFRSMEGMSKVWKVKHSHETLYLKKHLNF